MREGETAFTKASKMTERLLKPTDIPLIITSATSSPDSMGEQVRKHRKPSLDERQRRRPSQVSDRTPTTATATSRIAGGSLKYDIGRNNSIANLIHFPAAKWSSVRVKGTGYKDSRKSVVKIEPCNGTALKGGDYESLKSPVGSGHMKPNISNVSAAGYD